MPSQSLYIQPAGPKRTMAGIFCAAFAGVLRLAPDPRDFMTLMNA